MGSLQVLQIISLFVGKREPMCCYVLRVSHLLLYDIMVIRKYASNISEIFYYYSYAIPYANTKKCLFYWPERMAWIYHCARTVS